MLLANKLHAICCYRYHKGTDFQANHNVMMFQILKSSVVIDTTKVQIFKQITTANLLSSILYSCYRYHKGTDFQANHNYRYAYCSETYVVIDTTKVQIFKQITTIVCVIYLVICCYRYHKGTDFQANHNLSSHSDVFK